ncbi:MAG: phenylalanine--tRNA ligase beta subunit-related protein [Methanomicrobiaceae archaeon]|nr:phenylalanine--tRNA ligase beta subunit-related protein [Methanomicrobiaceae archaeon]
MQFSREVLDAFPGISVAEGVLRSVHVAEAHPGLAALREAVTRELQLRYTLEQVRDDPVFRAYRDFFWSAGVDPTKTRPASEALVRRILAGKPLPRINTAVDAYNLASASSGVPIAAFDADLLHGDLSLRFARQGEQFLGIGMKAPVLLGENQIIMTDAEDIIAIYPYRDADATKVTTGTTTIHIVACGVPKIEEERVVRAYLTCARSLEEYAGGTASAPQVSP